MQVDPSGFHLNNVADTCAVWNILSSRLLHSAACEAGCSFCYTYFVKYECLDKPRKNEREADTELKRRLRKALANDQFCAYHLDVEDLQEVEVLEKRRNLGKGELSSIAFAKKTRQAFMTDDQKARTLAYDVMKNLPVQTTPHLFGWLFFESRLVDSDKDQIIKQHTDMNRPLAECFEQMYREALRCRSMAQGSISPKD